MRDYGLAVSPTFRDSPLRQVSARAVQLWLFLASSAAHYAYNRRVGDHTIALHAGDTLFSMRTLGKELHWGTNRIHRALQELERVGAVVVERIEQPATSPKRRRERLQNGDVQRSGNGDGVRCLLSRISVRGMKALPRNGNVSKMETRSNTAEERDRDEITRIDQQLRAEGR